MKNNLYDVANLGYPEKYETKLKVLADMAQDEPWNFVDEKYIKDDHCFPILHNYLLGTYDRLVEEGKIAYSQNESHMCFNTGLQTDMDCDIFMLFSRNNISRNDSKKWYFVKFCDENHRDLRVFSKLPEIARYCERTSDFVFDMSISEIRINYEHIINDNIDRFDGICELDSYKLRSLLEGAFNRTICKVKRNYKLAIPQYYKDKNSNQAKIQLLLPLFINNRSKADLAIAIEKENGVYYATTILPLDWAYMNARRIVKPDVNWLLSNTVE